MFLLLLTSGSLHAVAQEMLLPLGYNQQLLHRELKGGARDIGESRDTLCLPFFDDFSNLNAFHDSINLLCPDTVFNTDPSAVYPNQLFWQDSLAYINNTYPIFPPTYGVATLDGLRANGRPHNELINYGPADTLTSRPFYLGGFIADTVYLSFYYQPGGFGDFPESDDSLVLEFLNIDGTWDRAWFTRNTVGAFNQPFKIVMVPVIDEAYLYDGFQFRFRNRANPKGNNDHWHIDYVYMDEDRTSSDTLFRDVSFTSVPTSILKRYRQMPWAQFKNHQAEELADNHFIQIKNNFNTIVNTSYRYEAFESLTGSNIAGPTAPISINFDPFSTAVNSYETFEIAESTPGYDEDSMLVTIEYTLDPAGDIQRLNDTLRFEQSFYNYFAYDDGSAEKAYALNGTGSQLAIRFFANEPDTLKEVYIHWSYIDGNKSTLFFSLIVWSDIDTTGLSDAQTVVYQADFLTPKYVDSVNGFYVYQLTDFLGNPTPVVVDGYFYVGWLQTQADFLNVGFDVNNIANQHVFYNTGGNWQRSDINGAIMIRPQVGGDYSVYTGVDSVPNAETISLYPNPVQQRLFVRGIVSDNYNITIYDISGRFVGAPSLESDFGFSVANLTPGLYIATIDNVRTSESHKLQFVKSQ